MNTLPSNVLASFQTSLAYRAEQLSSRREPGVDLQSINRTLALFDVPSIKDIRQLGEDSHARTIIPNNRLFMAIRRHLFMDVPSLKNFIEQALAIRPVDISRLRELAHELDRTDIPDEELEAFNRFPEAGYGRNQLFYIPGVVEILSMTWRLTPATSDRRPQIHNHGNSQGIEKVRVGTLQFTDYSVNITTGAVLCVTGETLCRPNDPSAIILGGIFHRGEPVGEDYANSIHAYFPPMEGVIRLKDDSGTMSISYTPDYCI